MIKILLESVGVGTLDRPDGGKELIMSDKQSGIVVVCPLPPEGCEAVANMLRGVAVVPAQALRDLPGNGAGGVVI